MNCRILPFTCNFPRILLSHISIIFIALSSLDYVYPYQNKLKNSALSGKNLMIMPLTAPILFRFNDSDKLQEHMSMPNKVIIDIVKWMTHRYNFTWAILPTNETTMEKPLNNSNKGSISYLLDGSCDLVVANILMTTSRNRLVDLPYPWAQSHSLFLTVTTDRRANFMAILKPFQLQVWILIASSIAVVVIVFQLFIRRTLNVRKKSTEFSSTTYVVGMLLSQGLYSLILSILIVFLLSEREGGPCLSKRTDIRLIAGAWCLACFVLVQAYNSTLITYVVAPNNEPSINSIEDIAKNTKINILLEKNMGLDSFFQNDIDERGVFRVIRDRLNAYPKSRCDLENQCIDLMLSSSGDFVYLKSRSYLKEIMLDDFKKTGQCRMHIVRDSLMNVLISFALAKRSPYTNSFSEGVIEMNSFGLINYWHGLNLANPYHCLNQNINKKRSSTTNTRLSLKNLTGAFVVLLVGFIFSLIIFIVECLKFGWHGYRCNTENGSNQIVKNN